MNRHRQTTNHILMVRPAHFGFNAQTAESNAFQQVPKQLSKTEIELHAIQEFDHFTSNLRAAGINVIVVQDTDHPVKTDAVFPNNWVTFHPNGFLITYPMEAPIRRLERRDDIFKELKKSFVIRGRMHLEEFETEGKFLEGTGSMIFDRNNKKVYACLSSRTNPDMVEEFCKITNYTPLLFTAVDENDQEIYHTNVMMAIGDQFVVICLETIREVEEKEMLLASFAKTNKTVIEISLEQMKSFAGNMLQVNNREGETFLVMSEQAFESLNTQQIEQIEKFTNILYSPIKTIETYGGGSVRCMMAEVFLPER